MSVNGGEGKAEGIYSESELKIREQESEIVFLREILEKYKEELEYYKAQVENCLL